MIEIVFALILELNGKMIEHLASQIESIEKEIDASRYNKVNIDHLKEQVDMLQKKANGNH